MKSRLTIYIFICFAILACGGDNDVQVYEPMSLEMDEVDALVELPLSCIHKEYPNKLNQVLSGPDDLKPPSVLHPSFYGCFDWHSAVHAHWSLFRLARLFPGLNNVDSIYSILQQNLTSEKLKQELDYFEADHNQSFERTYGWAWLLKLTAEIALLEDDTILKAIEPLADRLITLYAEYINKLSHPIRTGEHDNTAFSMNLVLDYAIAVEDSNLIALINSRALDFYIEDENCPIFMEPGGHDFLSPCLEEILLMGRVMERTAFDLWSREFLPELYSDDAKLVPLKVESRSDGKLVHLEGLNFSRARCLYALGSRYSELAHLIPIANEHVESSMSVIFEPEYSGSHWLASFAILSLTEHNPYANE